MSSESTQRRKYRRDYQPPDFGIDTVDLSFDLDPDQTIVTARLRVRRRPGAVDKNTPLVLDGVELELRAVRLDGLELDASRFEATPELLTIHDVPEQFVLETEVAVAPSQNTKLMGLYQSQTMLCTQCEAEGFRRITYYLDRPDVMARFTTRLEGDQKAYPVLLSNGNRTAQGELPSGRHFVQWEDPFPKPSYLFAVVAGDLVCKSGQFTTASGRDVALEIWVEHENADKCDHALASLEAAMKWDEDKYGLEYDLDTYMIVAVRDFNMGAMENKGLNVFNSMYVLADPASATDDDYEGIESVIGHEYFHNWTGNRVTCRDWFQLTLKEGLTVYRDQEFSADMTSPAIERIKDVNRLRTAQFAEDSGPQAHPIRPESYVEMNNFYTATVYEKGAEVVRLYETLLGKDGFRKGLRHYLEKHDGQAVTCDDFRAAIAEANGVDLGRFERWYSQAGTPTVTAVGDWDEASSEYRIELTQSQRSFPDTPPPLPLPIPLRLGLLGKDGGDIEGTAQLVELTESERTVRFKGIAERPVLSIGRGFSAPIKLEVERSDEALAFLLGHDQDPFNRWEAGQELGRRVALSLADRLAGDDNASLTLDPGLVAAFERVLGDETLDGSIKAMTLALPSEELLGQALDVVDPAAVHGARSFLVRELGRALRPQWLATYEAHSTGPDDINKREIDRRRIKNRALQYLAALGDQETTALAAAQFESASTMTDYQAAFIALVELDAPVSNEAIESFYERWKSDGLVLDKWFRIQAMSAAPSAFERVVALSKHPDYRLTNPNRARSLLYAFAFGNPVHFHRRDGAGYRFVADKVLELDAINPQGAARVVGAFNRWKRYEPGRQMLMKGELERIASVASLSKDAREIVERALAG